MRCNHCQTDPTLAAHPERPCPNNSPGCGCNPCEPCPPNTASCESLPSALENFIVQFFGSVQKTEVNGRVVWVLPCNLDIGLPNNPRKDNEGLACYFLRLFAEGINGLTGPQGPQGDQGFDGNNAYTITTTQFVPPTLASPNTQFNVIPSPILSVGLTIFVPGCGWLEITNIFQTRTVFAKLLEPISTQAAICPAGSVVLPTGQRGVSVTGPKGAKGDKGDKGDTGATGATGTPGATGAQGVAGTAATNANSQVIGGSTDYTLTGTEAKVDFGATDIEFTLEPGTYFLSASLQVLGAGGAAPDDCSFVIYNQTAGADVDGSRQDLTVVANRRHSLVLNAIVTINATSVFHINAVNATAARGLVAYLTSKFLYIKLA